MIEARRKTGESRVSVDRKRRRTNIDTVDAGSGQHDVKTATREQRGEHSTLEGYRGAVERVSLLARLIGGFRDSNH